MIDIYIDEAEITYMSDERGSTRLDFINKRKDEHIHIVMTDNELVKLYTRLKNRCEIKDLISIKQER